MVGTDKSKRVFFLNGEQRRFIIAAIEAFGGLIVLANKLGLSPRTVRDWRREKFSMTLKALGKIHKVVGLKIPQSIELRDRYWYTSVGSSAGGIAVYKKYGRIGGDPEKRKKRWREWWQRKGRLIHSQKHIFRRKFIKKPSFGVALAEFVGILMGDGGISQRQVCITLSHR